MLYYVLLPDRILHSFLRRSLLQDNGSWTFCGVWRRVQAGNVPVSFWKRVTSCGFRNMSIRIWRRKNFILYMSRIARENTGFDELMEYLVEHVDYQDESLVEYVYKAYEQYESAGEVYLQAKIFEDAECLRIPEKMDAVEEETTVVVGQDQEKDAIREEEKEMPVGEVTVIKEKKGLFNLWENRKKKEKQERDNYTRSLQLTMHGMRWPEETV